ncbi:zinc finger CCCH domain-containing protein 17-like [Bidens hawaiensis]|uniref:zinc finger CCCH domain-containing protein 17-like n=1 Tax=Bidens hawaiensis TaxID=980011 RepID=UPI0040498D0D
MVGGVTNQPPHGSQLAPPSSAAPAPAVLTEEEEFLKRNTDCVYFLASPLTCKKGSECEYRHSDIARVNPRDCWYWVNGNCLNPKCGFRHPPLDGLFEAEVPTPVGAAVPQAPVKQGVACVFFQKGYCMKGHFCPFWHGLPNTVNNIAVHPATKPSKVASVGLDKPVQDQKFTQQENVQKTPEIPPQGRQVQHRNGGPGSGVVMDKKVALLPEEPPRYKPANVVAPPVTNDVPPNRSNHVYEANHVSDNEGVNGKDVDEYSREPTPGFDVLVDNEVGDSEYYPNEEQFDMGRSVDYNVDHDTYHDEREVDRYAREDNRENPNLGRNRYPRDESADRFDRSDLRHRISQRRDNNVGGLRSVISREHPRDIHHNRHHDRNGTLSSRLRGRIKIPGRSMSPEYDHRSRVEREIDMRRHQRSRYSPSRPPHVSSNHNRFRDRIRGRSNDDFNNNGRDFRGYRGNDGGFRGLKSQLTDDGQKYPQTESQLFEGPKSLSEILKRKRGSVVSSVNNEDGDMVNADNGKSKSTDGQASLNDKVGSVDEDALLDQELEAYDQRDGDYDYGDDYNLEGEEYMEEEDENGTKESEVYS